MPSSLQDPEITDWRLWWFAQLESAISRDDRLAITEALRNLTRLGVELRFLFPLVSTKGAKDE